LWVAEEMALLAEPSTYVTAPEDAWRRLKPRSSSPRFLVVLKALAAWREQEAQDRDLPRQRVMRDETLMEVAAHAPTSAEDLSHSRGVSKSAVDGKQGAVVLEVVARALATPESEWPHVPERQELPRGLGPVVDLLKVLLKLKCDQHDVAQKLVASASDIDQIAADDEAAVAALHGWRRTIFGDDALRLKHGRIGLALAENGAGLRLLPLD
jgi:ribonuclease D